MSDRSERLRKRGGALRDFAARLTLGIVLALLLPASSRASSAAGDTLDLSDHPLAFDTNLGLIERATEEAVAKSLSGLNLPPGSEVRLHSITFHDASWFVEDHIARYLSDRGLKIYLQAGEKPAAKGPPAASAPPPASGGNTSLSDAMKATTPDSLRTGAGTDSSGDPPSDVGKTIGATTGSRNQNHAAENTAAIPDSLIPIPEGEGLVLTFRLVDFGVTYHDQWREGFLGQRVVERLASVDLYCRLVKGTAENVLWVGGGKSERLDIVPKSKLDLLEGVTYPFKPPTLQPQSISRILEPALVLGIIGGLVFLFYSNQN